MTPALAPAPEDFALPQVYQGKRELPEPLRVLGSGEQASFIEVSEDMLRKTRNRARNSTISTRRRLAAVGYILAQLPGITDEEAADLLGTSTTKLRKWVHGEDTVPESKMNRLSQLSLILVTLQRVLERDATARWLRTQVPALKNRTPLEELTRGRTDAVLELVRGYLDPSFG